MAGTDRIERLVEEVAETEREIAELDMSLSMKKAYLKDLIEEDIPEAMEEVGALEVTLKNGTKVKVGPFLYCRCSRENRLALKKWLDENGHSPIVRRTIEVNLGLNSEENEDFVSKWLASADIPFTQRGDVHWKTLESFVQELRKENKPVPEHLLTLHEGIKAEIKKG